MGWGEDSGGTRSERAGCTGHTQWYGLNQTEIYRKSRIKDREDSTMHFREERSESEARVWAEVMGLTGKSMGNAARKRMMWTNSGNDRRSSKPRSLYQKRNLKQVARNSILLFI